MTIHLCIAGHGKRPDGSFDPGATGHITKGEHRYMKEDLFPAMKKFLPEGHKVIFFSDYNVYAHGDIVSLAKKYGADEITEFHFDAASPSARGGHVIIHKNFKPDKVDLALRDAIKNMVGIRYSHRGHKGISGRNDLANVNRTANAGITYRLVELGFGTNEEDARIMIEEVDEYAKEIVEALTGSVVDKEPKKKETPKKKTTTKKKSTTKSNGKSKANLVVDGYWGKQTTRALQRYFGTPVDGEIWGQHKGNQAAQAITGGVKYGPPYGSPVIEALQKHVGAKADGVLGPQTVRALQRHLKTPVDGEIWKPSTMVKAMQKRLNGGDL